MHGSVMASTSQRLCCRRSRHTGCRRQTMLLETRGMEMTYRAEGTKPRNIWNHADFAGNFPAMRPAKPIASRSGFVVGIALRQVSLIVFVSDELSADACAGDPSRANLLAA